MLIRKATPEDVAIIRKLEQETETAAHWGEREYDALFAAEAPQRIALVAIGRGRRADRGIRCRSLRG